MQQSSGWTCGSKRNERKKYNQGTASASQHEGRKERQMMMRMVMMEETEMNVGWMGEKVSREKQDDRNESVVSGRG
jgi:hypothetical protein